MSTAAMDADLACRHCGFNLRGLATDRTCPECGTPVANSLREDWLRYSDPAWIRQVAQGARVLAWTIIAGIVLGMVAGGIKSADEKLGVLIELATNAAVSLVQVWAVWLATTPEPAKEIEPQVTARALARWGTLGSAVANLVSMVLALGSTGMSQANAAFAVVAGVMGLAGFFGTFVYARSLALRMPDPVLASQTKTVMWGYVITMGVGLLFVAIAAVTAGASGVGVAPLAAVACGVGIGGLVFGIWSIVLALRYSARLLAAADAAEHNWHAAG